MVAVVWWVRVLRRGAVLARRRDIIEGPFVRGMVLVVMEVCLGFVDGEW